MAKPGQFTCQEPFQAELVVWAFGDKILNTLIDLADEWGDLKQKDLLLGPCTQKQFQTWDINIASKAEWLADKARMQTVKEIYQNNQLADLMVAIGRVITRDQVTDDLEKVMRNYNIAHGKTTAPPIEDISEQVDVAGLLADEPTTPPEAETFNVIDPTEAPKSSGLDEFAKPEAESEGNVKTETKKAESKVDDELDLSEFLDL